MYNYQEEKNKIFTEKIQEMFLKIRDKSKMLLAQAGCFKMGKIINNMSGDNWTMMACVDRLVEIGEIKEVDQSDIIAQDRIFTSSTS